MRAKGVAIVNGPTTGFWLAWAYCLLGSGPALGQIREHLPRWGGQDPLKEDHDKESE